MFIHTYTTTKKHVQNTNTQRIIFKRSFFHSLFTHLNCNLGKNAIIYSGLPIIFLTVEKLF